MFSHFSQNTLKMISNCSQNYLKMACVTVFEWRSHLGPPAGLVMIMVVYEGLNLILVNLRAVRASPSLIMMLKNKDGNDEDGFDYEYKFYKHANDDDDDLCSTVSFTWWLLYQWSLSYYDYIAISSYYNYYDSGSLGAPPRTNFWPEAKGRLDFVFRTPSIWKSKNNKEIPKSGG